MKVKTEKEIILEEISRESKGKDIEWYKKELSEHKIPFIEFKTATGSLVIPECVYNKLSQVKKKKISKAVI